MQDFVSDRISVNKLERICTGMQLHGFHLVDDSGSLSGEKKYRLLSLQRGIMLDLCQDYICAWKWKQGLVKNTTRKYYVINPTAVNSQNLRGFLREIIDVDLIVDALEKSRNWDQFLSLAESAIIRDRIIRMEKY